MMTTAPLNTKYPHEIIDPTTNMPYKDAQVLWPCAESISREKAKEIFGKMTDAGVCEVPAPCPRCETRTIAYKPNSDLQRLVDLYLLNSSCPSEIKFPVYPLPSSLFTIQARYSHLLEFKAQNGGDDPIYIFSVNTTKKEGYFWFHPNTLYTTLFYKNFVPHVPEGLTFSANGEFRWKDTTVIKNFVIYMMNNNRFTTERDKDLALQML